MKIVSELCYCWAFFAWRRSMHTAQVHASSVKWRMPTSLPLCLSKRFLMRSKRSDSPSSKKRRMTYEQRSASCTRDHKARSGLTYPESRAFPTRQCSRSTSYCCCRLYTKKATSFWESTHDRDAWRLFLDALQRYKHNLRPANNYMIIFCFVIDFYALLGITGMKKGEKSTIRPVWGQESDNCQD